MLRVKSFKIEDDKGLNELLENYRLAKGAGGILVSNGYIMVPYEDGERDTLASRIIAEKEAINELLGNKEEIESSNRVNEQQLQETESELIVATEAMEKETSNPIRKKYKAKVDGFQSYIDNTKSMIYNNNKELARLEMNVERIQDKIDILEEQLKINVERIDEYRGIVHTRRHLASSPIFKGIPDFRQTRIAMLRATKMDELMTILEDCSKILKEQ